MASLSDKIGFDITQQERGRITSNYQGLKELFEEEDFVCEEFNEFPITLELLEHHGMLIFACPDSSKLRPDEVEALLQYVKKGGNLLLLNHAGGDQGRRTNLGELTSGSGINFRNNEVLDPLSNLGMESYPLITKFNDHPIVQNIPDICYRIGCTLEISEEAIPLAFTTDSAEPPQKPTLALASFGKGYIIASGSYEMFMDEVRGGIKYPNNAKLIKNIIQWLRSKGTSKPLLKAQPQKSRVMVKDLDQHHPAIESERDGISSTDFEKIQKVVSQCFADIRNLKDEIKTILDANTEIKEKLSIFELNLADFPNEAVSENNLEIQDLYSKLKTQSKSISKLQQEVSKLKKDSQKVKLINDSKFKLPSSTKPSEEIIPITTPIITTNGNEVIPVATPVIDTADKLLDKENKTMDPRIVAEMNAYTQIIQILENQFKTGTLSEDQYQKKRLKFEKRIAELEHE